MEFRKIKQGQHVVYGTNGICFVENISEMAFPTGGEKKQYLILRPLSDRGSIIYIPHDNEVLLGRLRPLITKKEANGIWNTPITQTVAWEEDRKQRAASFKEYLLKNDIYTLLSMILCICQKRDLLTEQNKKLTNADREMLAAALKSVCEELAFSLGLSREAVSEKLKEHLKIAL